MSLSRLVLVVWVFLLSATGLGWLSVSAHFIDWVGIAFVVLAILEAVGVLAWSLPLHRRAATQA